MGVMRKTYLLKPILIHVLISVFAGMIFNIIGSFDKLMINDFIRNIIYIIESVIIIFLYLLLGSKFLNEMSGKVILNSVVIILALNLILGLSGYLMMNFGSQIMAENGQLPIIILTLFNYGFNPLVYLITLPELLGILLPCFMSPVFLYLGSRKLVTTK
jgi:hypothetical protein